MEIAVLVLVSLVTVLISRDHSERIERRLAERGVSSALHRAIVTDDLREAKRLLNAGVDPNLCDVGGNRPLHVVESKAAVRLLLDFSADPNALNDEFETPLHTVADAGVLRALIVGGADVSFDDKMGETPLHDANSVAAAKIFIGAGVDVKHADRRGNTALHAVQDAGLARFLIKNGADLKAMNRQFRLPIHEARNSKIAEVLLAAGSPTGGTLSPLHTARSAAIVRSLVRYGCDVDVRNDIGQTPLMRPCNRNVARELILQGADIEAKDHRRNTALYYALRRPEVAAALLESGADVHARINRGRTLIELAISRNDQAMIDLFLEHGVSFRGLRFSAHCQMPVIRRLVEAGAIPYQKSLRNASKPTLTYLKSKGFNVDLSESRG